MAKGDDIADAVLSATFAFAWFLLKITVIAAGTALLAFASFARSGFTSIHYGPGKQGRREWSETKRLYDEVKRTFDASPYCRDEAIDDFVYDVVVESCDRAAVAPAIPLGEALWQTTRGLLKAEGSIFGFPESEPSPAMTLEEGVALRDYLNRKRRFLSDDKRLLDMWREKVIRTFEGILRYVPPSAFSDNAEEETSPSVPFSTALIDLCDTPAEVVERTIVTFFDEDITNAHLFDGVREELDRRALMASGIPPERKHETTKSIVLPTAARSKSNAELVETYLGRTPFAHLFEARLPFTIPFPIRFEHTLIVGGTGHGKTQLLQLLIHEDIRRARDDGRSVVVIDSQGDLIRTISRLSYFDPAEAESLADRLLIIDPNDVEYPVCLNMFDWSRDRLATYKPVDREKILNGTVELYEYLFGALLGAELTQRQGLIFKYLARLMMEIPEATIHTLRALMEDGEPFRPYMEKLPPTARSFFETRFFDRSFNETKKQILTRLWGVLSNATFDRMFSHPKNKVDIFEATRTGKIILINTAKELLKQDGCAIFGRFFIALLAQATIQRSTLAPHERTPTFVYIDEAQDYFDENIEHLLTQARKYRLGMVLAHQNLDQLGAGLRASVMANTSIKLAGGVSAKDASVFASEMRSSPEFIQSMRKERAETKFACHVRNLMPHAIEVSVPLGSVEPHATLSDEAFGRILAENRNRYCAPAAEVDALARVAVPIRAREKAPPSRPAAQPRAATPPQPTMEYVQAPGIVAAPSVAAPPRQAEPSDRPMPDGPQHKAAAEPRSPPVRRTLREPPPLGRGGQQHQYFQHLFKQAAEERGFKAVIEEPILEGSGRVDVSMSRGKRKIACEISITTPRDQELGNVEKCLAAGYDEVIVVASSERQRASLGKFITAHLEEVSVERVCFLLPVEVIARLDEIAATEAVTETTSRGYKVRVTQSVVTDEEKQARRAEIAAVIGQSIMRQKNKKTKG